MTVNISEAKAQLSRLVELVYRGESVTIAKNNLPIVDLVPHTPQGRRTLGSLAGRISVPDDFDREDEELIADFHGESRA